MSPAVRNALIAFVIFWNALMVFFLADDLLSKAGAGVVMLACAALVGEFLWRRFRGRAEVPVDGPILLTGDERWDITPDSAAVEVSGRRFVASLTPDDFDKLVAAGVPRRPGNGETYDVREDYRRVLGRDPFREIVRRT